MTGRRSEEIGPNRDASAHVDGGADHGIVGYYLDGHRFPGEHRRAHRRAVDDDTVGSARGL